MKSKIWGLLAVGLLAGPMVANAASIRYEFETTLGLLSGTDANNLDGKSVQFTAIISYGSTYGTKFDSPAVDSVSHSWVISGGSSIDGTYTGSAAADWYPTFAGWFDDGGFFTFAGSNDVIAIYHTPTAGSFLGEPVSLSDFGALQGVRFDQAVNWTVLGSSYNWFSNASFSVSLSEPNGVPEPGTLALLGLGLVGIGMRRRIKAS